MERPRDCLVAAALFLLIGANGPAAQQAIYDPIAPRLEILQGWEKADRSKPPAEIVAGIYELDYRRSDFRNEIAITIDDAGPNKYLVSILDTLKRHGVKAVFFIIGSYFLDSSGRPTPRARELLRRIVAEGHEIGSHSFWHRRMDEPPYRDDPAAIGAELDRNQAAIDEVLGYHYPIKYFRPPNGAHSTPRYELDKALIARGQYLANWTITAFDWNIRLKNGNPDHLSPDQVLARTLKQAREESGGVILLHGFPTTAAILDRLLDELASASNAKGDLVFSTLDDIMALKYAGRLETSYR